MLIMDFDEFLEFPVSYQTVAINDIDKQLIRAVEENDYLTLEELINGTNYIDINVKNNLDETPLNLSVRKNHFECFSLLLKNKNTMLNSKNIIGMAAIHNAIVNKNKEMTYHLLEDWRLDVNSTTTFRETAIHMLCKWGEPELLQLIIKNDQLDANMFDHRKNTPLIILFEEYGFTGKMKYIDCINILLQIPTIEIILPPQLEALEHVWKKIIHHPTFHINNRLNKSDTLLSYSCRTNNRQLFDELMEYPDIDINQFSPIDIALENYNFDFFIKLAEREDVWVTIDTIDNIFSYCFLSETIIKYIRLFLPKIKIEEIIQLCIDHNTIDILKVFIRGGVNYEIGHKPLLHYCLLNNNKIFRYLVSNYSYDLSIKCADTGNSLLHLAIKMNSNIAEYLIKNNVETDVKNFKGRKPIHVAIKYRKEDIIARLLSKNKISMKEQIELLDFYRSEFIVHQPIEYYGNYLENMPVEHFCLYEERKKDLPFFRDKIVYKEVELDKCHNTRDIFTLDSFDKCDEKEIIQYGSSIEGKYRTINLYSFLKYIEAQSGTLGDILDPIDRTRLCEQTVLSTGLPLFIDLVYRMNIF